MKKNKNIRCSSCSKENVDKDTIAINKKLLGRKIEDFYCLDCLATYLNVSVEDIKDKIEQFKEMGCDLFK